MDYRGFLKEAEEGRIPLAVLLHGTEGHLLDDALARITQALFPDPSVLPFCREVFDAGEATAEMIVGSALTLPLLAAARLVVVKAAQELPEKASAPLVEYLRVPHPAARLLFVADRPLPPTHWLVKSLPRSAVVELPRITGRDLVAWLRARAQARGYELAEAAAELLVEWVGTDLARLSSELEKAGLYCGPGKSVIGEEEVKQVVGEHRIRRAFELADAVEQQQIGPALALLDALLASGEEPLALLSILAREVRTTWQVNEWLRQGKSAEEVARLLRRPPFAVETLCARATSLSTGALSAALTRCWQVERRLKSGGDPRAELSVLVADLVRAG